MVAVPLMLTLLHAAAPPLHAAAPSPPLACRAVERNGGAWPQTAKEWRSALGRAEPLVLTGQPLRWTAEMMCGDGSRQVVALLSASSGSFPYLDRSKPLHAAGVRTERSLQPPLPVRLRPSELLHQLRSVDGFAYSSSSLLKAHARAGAGASEPLEVNHRSALGDELLHDPLLPLLAAAASVQPASLEVSMWLGSRGATTPLHDDTSTNLFLNIEGEKRLALLPPAAALAGRARASAAAQELGGEGAAVRGGQRAG